MIVARRAQNNEAAHRTKAEASEKLAEASARDATASLYGSLLGQARATRLRSTLRSERRLEARVVMLTSQLCAPGRGRWRTVDLLSGT